MMPITASDPACNRPRGRLLQTAILALAGAAIAAPGIACSAERDAFDGDWSVVITTQDGACDPSLRYGVKIADGEVLNRGNIIADIRGRVGPRGLIRVDVKSGDQWASGSGRLGTTGGTGSWSGQGSAGLCAGTWVAQR